MNDKELDELLDTWSAPPPPASLRQAVRSDFAMATPRVRRTRRRLFAVAALAATAFLLVVASALPQTVKVVAPFSGIPYTVDSEFVSYAPDGSPAQHIFTTSYSRNGNEVILSRSEAGNPLHTALWQVVVTVHLFLSGIMQPLGIMHGS